MSDQTPEPSRQPTGSYRRILAATSILGGATAVNVLVGMVRAKVVAMTLGPPGMGVMGAYMSVSGLVASLSSCGLNYSGVREISEATGAGDEERARRARLTFERLSWRLGIGGTLVMAALAWPASWLMFGNLEHGLALALLGLTVAMTLATNYHSALIQAAGQLTRIARLNVIGGVLVALVAAGSFLAWRREGIVPALIGGAVAQMAVAWFYARDLALPRPTNDTQTDKEIGSRLLRLGGTMVLIGQLASMVILAVRAILIRHLGEDAAGLFQSAYSLSGMYAGYILGAMGTDFLPRLSAVAGDDREINRLVNEQTTVALLLGLPGVVATIALAPVIIPVFYSRQFGDSVPLLQLMAVGVFGRLVSWPLSFAVIAKGATRQSLTGELIAHACHLIVVLAAIPFLGVQATGLASIVVYVVYSLVMYRMIHGLTGLRWTAEVWKALLMGVLAMAVSLGAQHWLPPVWKWTVSVLCLSVVSIVCVRRLILAAGVTQSGLIRRLRKLLPAGKAAARGDD